MEKAKSPKTALYYLSKIVGRRTIVERLSSALARRYESTRVHFPHDFSSAKRVLMLLPEEPLDALLQISSIVSYLWLFRQASVVFFCEKKVAAFFSGLRNPAITVVEYDRSDRFVFSAVFEKHRLEFSNDGFDVCLLLEKSPDLSLLLLAGWSGADVRAGYADADAFPLLNVRLSGRSAEYLHDQNVRMARLFGALPRPRSRWIVSKEAAAAIDQLLRDAHLEQSRLVLIDGCHFHGSFTEAWTRSLLSAVKCLPGLTPVVLLFGEQDASTHGWFARQELPLLPDLSLSHCAALIQHSVLTITGKSPVFELANLLDIPVIGLFERSEMARYCKDSARSRGLAYGGRPNEDTVTATAALARMLLSVQSTAAAN